MERYGLYEAALISDIYCLKSVEYLLVLVCNIDQQKNTNSTPLYVASYDGHEKVIGLLISYGANENVKNIYGSR
ncbi:unnamed protein product (macronuclear) [Paramecium tetraurelia]|uniref:Uncharacterized protein n=1 Tax=Paramecium tetraurelia TaxID=5888 RepID=A0DDY3_PARTE|nr:uncharacterized protein GSPATT00016092001 [Paramecium tetraurelia]CAK81250.1 unnamed protein product [Paramecium tetraurelia]|eukprot:XP_001448647.1 hypothetical protein (macronuclear) [Paramecium tetraurelia strain d4-2]